MLHTLIETKNKQFKRMKEKRLVKRKKKWVPYRSTKEQINVFLYFHLLANKVVTFCVCHLPMSWLNLEAPEKATYIKKNKKITVWNEWNKREKVKNKKN